MVGFFRTHSNKMFDSRCSRRVSENHRANDFFLTKLKLISFIKNVKYIFYKIILTRFDTLKHTPLNGQPIDLLGIFPIKQKTSLFKILLYPQQSNHDPSDFHTKKIIFTVSLYQHI